MDKRDILKVLVGEVGKGDLSFQTHATVTLRVQRALDDPDISVADIAKLIQADPMLAARVVAVANSAAFNSSGRSIANVCGAVTRLGLRNVRSMVTALMVRQMSENAGSIDPLMRRMSAQLWEHTAHVTALCRLLARRVTHVDAEVALFTAIVHDVGGFYLLSRSPDFPGLLEGDPADWDEADLLEQKVDLGRAVLTALAIPDVVMAVLEGYWQGFLAMPPRTLSDTLLLAEDLAPVTSPFHQAKNPTLPDGDDAASAMTASIEMILGEGTLSSILHESSEEVISLAIALQL